MPSARRRKVGIIALHDIHTGPMLQFAGVTSARPDDNFRRATQWKHRMNRRQLAFIVLVNGLVSLVIALAVVWVFEIRRPEAQELAALYGARPEAVLASTPAAAAGAPAVAAVAPADPAVRVLDRASRGAALLPRPNRRRNSRSMSCAAATAWSPLLHGTTCRSTTLFAPTTWPIRTSSFPASDW